MSLKDSLFLGLQDPSLRVTLPATTSRSSLQSQPVCWNCTVFRVNTVRSYRGTAKPTAGGNTLPWKVHPVNEAQSHRKINSWTKSKWSILLCVFVCSGQVVLFAAVTRPSVVSRARLPSRAHLPLAPGQHFSISPSCLVSEETKPKPSACSSSSDTTIHNSATFKQLLHQEHSEHKTKRSAMQVTTASCASWYLLFRLVKCIEPFFLSGFKSKYQLFPGKKLTFLGEISLCLNTSLTKQALCSLTHLLQKISRTSTGKEILCSLETAYISRSFFPIFVESSL